MTKRKFFKTVIKIEVLSEGAPISQDLEIGEIMHECTEGEWSGDVRFVAVKMLNGKSASIALRKQGSDPGFFNLTDKGDDVEN